MAIPRAYDLEFKDEAVRMASEPGVTARDVESRLGIGPAKAFFHGGNESWPVTVTRRSPERAI